MLIGEAAVHLYRPGGQDSRHAVEPHARTVTADGYLKSRVRACRGSHPNCRRRLEYTTLTRLHLDIPSMQCNQRGAMPDGNDGHARQNLAQHAVDFRFQLLVKRRCRLIEKQPIRLVENSPRDSQTLLLAARKALGPVVLAVDFAGN